MNQAKVLFLMTGLMVFMVLVGGLIGGEQMALVFFGIALVMNVGMYWFSDRMVLKMYKARVVSREDAPDLYEMVDRLRQQANLPMPTVAIAPQEQPNAFATGRNAKNGVVCVTAGLLRLMNRQELEGVIAHELAHIKHRHMLVSTVAAAMAGAIVMIARWGIFFGDRDRNMVVAILLMILAPLAAFIVKGMISRTNEFQADRTGAEIAGSPDGLANALRRLEGYAERIPMDVNQAGASLAIVNPLRGRGAMGAMSKLFSTHPPTEDRIAALNDLRGTF
ncbi:MAG: protease HtpX [Gemmatimonadales bacterium]|nr:MAG: protease HtpX [Gemmatimonadales bacterium]